jgi:hypothetical protein
MYDVMFGLIVTMIFIFLISKSSSNKNHSQKKNDSKLKEPFLNQSSNEYNSSKTDLQHINKHRQRYSDREYDINYVYGSNNSFKKKVKEESKSQKKISSTQLKINQGKEIFNLHEKKIRGYFNEYLPLNHIKLSPKISDVFIPSLTKYDDEYFYFTPFHDFVQKEFDQIDCTLYGVRLSFIGTREYFFLYNEFGMIYTSHVVRTGYKIFKYKIELLIPIEYIDHFEILRNDSNIEIRVNQSYFREVLKRIGDPIKMLDTINKVYTFSTNIFSIKKEYYTFCNNSIKENYKLTIEDSLKLFVETKSISLLECIINLKLGRLVFDFDLILFLIFDTRNIGSVTNKHKIDLKISETSSKILSSDDMKKIYRSKIKSESCFYTHFNLDSYFENINIDYLRDTLNYKKFFDYWVHVNDNPFFDNHPNPFFQNLESSYPIFYGGNKKEFLSEGILRGPILVELIEFIQEDLRKVENEIRIMKGFNVVGSFTNETILFNLLKDYFSDCTVISQGSPKWLGRQKIDIYFPDYNIGVEYHGDQHFLPIDFFGGEDGLRYRKELDIKKDKLCSENGCKLFIVDKSYNIEELISQLKEEINKRL